MFIWSYLQYGHGPHDNQSSLSGSSPGRAPGKEVRHSFTTVGEKNAVGKSGSGALVLSVATLFIFGPSHRWGWVSSLASLVFSFSSAVLTEVEGSLGRRWFLASECENLSGLLQNCWLQIVKGTRFKNKQHFYCTYLTKQNIHQWLSDVSFN